MNAEHWRLVLTYAGMFAAWQTWELRRHPWRPAARGTWFATWVTALGCGVESLNSAFACAGWVFAAGLVSNRKLAYAGAVATLLEIALRLGARAGGMAALGIAGGMVLTVAMRERRWLLFRIGAHWASFIGTFALGVPLALSRLLESGAPLRTVGLASGLVGAALAAWGTWSFFRIGGTPEPFDPPSSLVTDGPYAHVRHPIQIAEVCFVLAGVAWFPSQAAALYVVGFAVSVFGPARVMEESALLMRFGAKYASWKSDVPAYLPRCKVDRRRKMTPRALDDVDPGSGRRPLGERRGVPRKT